MARSQGRYFSEQEVNRIVMLLRESDIALRDIADRMHCSRSAVASINRKFQVRAYEGKRSHWSLTVQSESPVQDLESLPFEVKEFASRES